MPTKYLTLCWVWYLHLTLAMISEGTRESEPKEVKQRNHLEAAGHKPTWLQILVFLTNLRCSLKMFLKRPLAFKNKAFPLSQI